MILSSLESNDDSIFIMNKRYLKLHRCIRCEMNDFWTFLYVVFFIRCRFWFFGDFALIIVGLCLSCWKWRRRWHSRIVQFKLPFSFFAERTGLFPSDHFTEKSTPTHWERFWTLSNHVAFDDMCEYLRRLFKSVRQRARFFGEWGTDRRRRWGLRETIRSVRQNSLTQGQIKWI